MVGVGTSPLRVVGGYRSRGYTYLSDPYAVQQAGEQVERADERDNIAVVRGTFPNGLWVVWDAFFVLPYPYAATLGNSTLRCFGRVAINYFPVS